MYTNALIHEASPYLLQHAHNPVDWLPWGDAAFEKARAENKPVFLSIGYAACHWCHVMAHESFENDEIAALLNEHFVSIKVDREERPDVDHLYMQALQRMTGTGGWPLSIFLTPDRKPFYAGTYWPLKARYGRSGFVDVLRGVVDAWTSEHRSVVVSAVALHDAIHAEVKLPPAQGKLSPELLDKAVSESERSFDSIHGGFSRAPKFPHAMELAMLLRCFARTGNGSAKHMIELTLDNMARGGIFDQIGGGFHRYSTDEKWLVPHFEKMLYDNALLLNVYADAADLLSRRDFERVASRTSAWAREAMWLSEGGFASSLDADSDGEEGTYYLWTPDEVAAILGDAADIYCQQFDIASGGNFEGKSIPNQLAAKAGLEHSEPTADEWMMKAHDLLRQRRSLRTPPARDDKALCDWNGLMISSAVRQSKSLEAARSTAHRFLSPLERDGELVHSFLDERELRVQLLMDYAALGNGLLDLFCATGELRWFDGAYRLADEIELRFARGDGLYYMSEESVAGVRPLDLYDSALPSGNSLSGNLFIKLFYLTREERFRERAEKQINALLPYLEQMPTVFSQALLTAEWLMFPPEQVVVVYPRSNTDFLCLPNHNRQVVHMFDDFAGSLPDGHPLAELLESKKLVDGVTTFYLCRNFVCEPPTTDFPTVLEKMSRQWQN